MQRAEEQRQAPIRERRRRLWRALTALAALSGVALLAAACSSTPSSTGVASLGSNSSTTTTAPAAGASGVPVGSSTKRSAGLAFSLCMRQHGLPDFPEPNAQGAIQVSAGAGSDLNPNNPKFQAAQKACQKDLPGGNLTPAQQQQALASALKLANCMHQHGITDFPEPNSKGEFQINAGAGSDLNPNNPKFQAAQRACGSGLPGGKGGGISIQIRASAPAGGSK